MKQWYNILHDIALIAQINALTTAVDLHWNFPKVWCSWHVTM